MATNQMSKVIQHLRRAVLLRDGEGLTDGQLLECFIEHREEAAFTALVRRHGPMVWSVCRRLLNHHDAEDAFQATFLVLCRKVASIQPREMAANWLYGVAHQTALQARRTAARRRARERQVTEMPEPAVPEKDLWRDLQPLLDEELSRLPDKYRCVIVLCDLEGKTRKEAARQLGVPEGTVAGWLARARTMLAKRLTRHGFALSGGALAAVLSEKVASASVSISAVSSTIKAAGFFAAGQAATAGSANVVGLAEEVLRAMLLAKLKQAAAVILILAVFGLGTGTWTHSVAGEKPAQAQKGESKNSIGSEAKRKEEPRRERHTAKKWHIVSLDGVGNYVDLNQRTVTIMSPREPGSNTSTGMTLDVEPTATIIVDDKQATLADLKTDYSVLVNVEYEWEFRDKAVVRSRAVRIEALGSEVGALVRALSHDGSTITVQSEDKGAITDAVYRIAPDAKVVINNKKGRLADVRPKMQVSLHMSAVKPLVVGVTAAGPKVEGIVTAVHPAEHTISLNIKNTHLTSVGVPVAQDARVMIDGKEGKLADLQAGERVIVHMSAESDKSLSPRPDNERGSKPSGTSTTQLKLTRVKRSIAAYSC
jgi:RNA polymerase sigma factor (sigma-70 family)